MQQLILALPLFIVVLLGTAYLVWVATLKIVGNLQSTTVASLVALLGVVTGAVLLSVETGLSAALLS
jgi:hypothetical protein